MRICTIEGCGKKHFGKGLCAKHYSAQLRKDPINRARENAQERERLKDPIKRARRYKKAAIAFYKRMQDPEKHARKNEQIRKSNHKMRQDPIKLARLRKQARDSAHNRRAIPKIGNRMRKQLRKRRKTDIQFRISTTLRARLNQAVHRNQKVGSAVRDLGCTIEFFITWIESQFEPWMTWKNWGHRPSKEHPRVWHFDHKSPLTAFDLTDRIQLLEACHYTNLQPLESTKNLSKGGKYDGKKTNKQDKEN